MKQKEHKLNHSIYNNTSTYLAIDAGFLRALAFASAAGVSVVAVVAGLACAAEAPGACAIACAETLADAT